MGGRSQHTDHLVDGNVVTIIVFSIACGTFVLSVIILYFFYLLSVGSDGENNEEANLWILLQTWGKNFVRNNHLDSRLKFHHNNEENKSANHNSKEESAGSSSKRSAWSISALFAGPSSRNSSFRVTPLASSRHTSSTLPSIATSQGTSHATNYHSSSFTFEQTTNHTFARTTRAISALNSTEETIRFHQKPRKMVYYSTSFPHLNFDDAEYFNPQNNRNNRTRRDEASKRDENDDNYSTNGFERSCRLDFLPSIIETQSSRDDATITPTPTTNRSNISTARIVQQHHYLPPPSYPMHYHRVREDLEDHSPRPVDIQLPFVSYSSSPPRDGGLIADHNYMEIDLPAEEYYHNNNDYDDDNDDNEDAKSIPLD